MCYKSICTVFKDNLDRTDRRGGHVAMRIWLLALYSSLRRVPACCVLASAQRPSFRSAIDWCAHWCGFPDGRPILAVRRKDFEILEDAKDLHVLCALQRTVVRI